LATKAIKNHFSIRIVLIVALLSVAASLPIGAIAAGDTDGISGLYDEAGKFDESERAAIEEAIDDVVAAGAPTVVYLQLLHTDDDRAVQYGQELMEDWDIESSPGARDGVVIFFNLDPEDTDRGEFGIVSGETHFDEGALPQSRLNSIRNEMTDLLVEDRMADAVVLGLGMTEDYLISGPPEPTAFEVLMGRIASGPMSLVNALGIVLAGIFAWIGVRTWRDRPQATNVIEPVETSPPADLHPSLAGALVQGNVDYIQVEALLLDLAQNGAIALEPDPKKDDRTQIRILNQQRAFTPAELELLTILVDEAGDDQVLDQDALIKARHHWPRVQDIIRKDLEERGWFDPEVGQHRRPLWIAGAPALFFGALAAFIPAMVLNDVWPLIGGGALALVGAILLGLASIYPRTTVEGQRQAAPWRGYHTGLKRAARDDYGAIDLDESFSYIVSMGLLNDFKTYLKTANDSGYVPLWVRTNEYQHQQLGTYWHLHVYSMHNAMHTAASGGSTGAGGAATGSGGAGGRF
jgi:uncharacterized membrane protein YgcG